jgi:hypothetical protein
MPAGYMHGGGSAMKKKFVTLLATLLCLGIALNNAEAKPKPKPKPKKTVAKPGPSQPKSIEVKLGLAMMYDWWKPAFMKLERGLAGNILSKNRKTIYDGSLMMGPTVWLKIGSTWNLGATALFGLTRNMVNHSTVALEANYLYLTIPSSMVDVYIDSGTSKIRRYDADVLIERIMYKFISLLIAARFN